ncbi:hypothetical protein Rhow_002065 [Rhodococcus wratislaviensis]|uniref:Uncharacterized protein n=1 Tax=Rhodococcus wratislaviensis TaxID=44752 RepID=A0A402C4L8_RHOWR|nr:DUF3592 domain-containing protein [Rhodococcus wratislaviensis]GCE38541.1 hypothetical protein Rhow_002065 [Rhodococcus wratislaviensis]
MMSTVDPAAKRRAAQLGRRPSARKAAAVLVMLFVAGCALTLLGLISWISLCVKHGRGGPLYGPATAALGLGAGWLYAAAHTDPGPDELAQGAPMSVFPPLPGFVALGAAAVLTALAVLVSVRRGRRRRAAARTVRSGTQTVGTVTDKGYREFTPRPFGPSTILTVVTFTFVDANDVQRWVRRRMLISSDAPVLDGQATKIWYDAADPGNETRIVVELATTSAR